MSKHPSAPPVPSQAPRAQRVKAFLIMLAFGLLTFPAILAFCIATVPIGIGVVLLLIGLDWVMYLYPFLFTGVMNGKQPMYFFAGPMSYAATLIQWVLVAYVFSIYAQGLKTRNMVWMAALVMVALAFAIGIGLKLAGLDVVYEKAHM
jgi:hypothetical protein